MKGVALDMKEPLNVPGDCLKFSQGIIFFLCKKKNKTQKCSKIRKEISVGRIQIADKECISHCLKHVKLLSNVVLISYQTLIQLTDFKILNWIRTTPRIIRTENLFTLQD